MSEITYNEYWTEVSNMAKMLWEEHETRNEYRQEKVSDMAKMAWKEHEAHEDTWDHGLHESVDGHRWIIYCAYNDDVIRHSDNEEYYEQNVGVDDMAYTLREKGFDGLKTVIAYYAFYADIADKLATMEK